jgi:hypothetical protein
MADEAQFSEPHQNNQEIPEQGHDQAQGLGREPSHGAQWNQVLSGVSALLPTARALLPTSMSSFLPALAGGAAVAAGVYGMNRFADRNRQPSYWQAVKGVLGQDDHRFYSDNHENRFKGLLREDEQAHRQAKGDPRSEEATGQFIDARKSALGKIHESILPYLHRNAMYGQYQDPMHFVKKNAEGLNHYLGLTHGYYGHEIDGGHEDLAPTYGSAFNNSAHSKYLASTVEAAIHGLQYDLHNATSPAAKERIRNNLLGLVGLHGHYASSGKLRTRDALLEHARKFNLDAYQNAQLRGRDLRKSLLGISGLKEDSDLLLNPDLEQNYNRSVPAHVYRNQAEPLSEAEFGKAIDQRSEQARAQKQQQLAQIGRTIPAAAAGDYHGDADRFSIDSNNGSGAISDPESSDEDIGPDRPMPVRITPRGPVEGGAFKDAMEMGRYGRAGRGVDNKNLRELHALKQSNNKDPFELKDALPNRSFQEVAEEQYTNLSSDFKKSKLSQLRALTKKNQDSGKIGPDAAGELNINHYKGGSREVYPNVAPGQEDEEYQPILGDGSMVKSAQDEFLKGEKVRLPSERTSIAQKLSAQQKEALSNKQAAWESGVIDANPDADLGKLDNRTLQRVAGHLSRADRVQLLERQQKLQDQERSKKQETQEYLQALDLQKEEHRKHFDSQVERSARDMEKTIKQHSERLHAQKERVVQSFMDELSQEREQYDLQSEQGRQAFRERQQEVDEQIRQLDAHLQETQETTERNIAEIGERYEQHKKRSEDAFKQREAELEQDHLEFLEKRRGLTELLSQAEEGKQQALRERVDALEQEIEANDRLRKETVDKFKALRTEEIQLAEQRYKEEFEEMQSRYEKTMANFNQASEQRYAQMREEDESAKRDHVLHSKRVMAESAQQKGKLDRIKRNLQDDFPKKQDALYDNAAGRPNYYYMDAMEPEKAKEFREHFHQEGAKHLASGEFEKGGRVNHRNLFLHAQSMRDLADDGQPHLEELYKLRNMLSPSGAAALTGLMEWRKSEGVDKLRDATGSLVSHNPTLAHYGRDADDAEEEWLSHPSTEEVEQLKQVGAYPTGLARNLAMDVARIKDRAGLKPHEDELNYLIAHPEEMARVLQKLSREGMPKKDADIMAKPDIQNLGQNAKPEMQDFSQLAKPDVHNTGQVAKHKVKSMAQQIFPRKQLDFGGQAEPNLADQEQQARPDVHEIGFMKEEEKPLMQEAGTGHESRKANRDKRFMVHDNPFEKNYGVQAGPNRTDSSTMYDAMRFSQKDLEGIQLLPKEKRDNEMLTDKKQFEERGSFVRPEIKEASTDPLGEKELLHHIFRSPSKTRDRSFSSNLLSISRGLNNRDTKDMVLKALRDELGINEGSPSKQQEKTYDFVAKEFISAFDRFIDGAIKKHENIDIADKKNGSILKEISDEGDKFFNSHRVNDTELVGLKNILNRVGLGGLAEKFSSQYIDAMGILRSGFEDWLRRAARKGFKGVSEDAMQKTIAAQISFLGSGVKNDLSKLVAETIKKRDMDGSRAAKKGVRPFDDAMMYSKK